MLTANPRRTSTPENREHWGKVWRTADRARPFDVHQPRTDERPSLLRRLLGIRL